MKPFMMLAVLTLLLSSCATIISGASPTLFNARSQPTGAKVTLKGLQNGETLVGETPATFSLSKGSDYELTFALEGYRSKQVIVRRTINGWFWGNLIIGGIPGWIIDAATGSMWQHQFATIDVDFSATIPQDDGSILVHARLQYVDEASQPYFIIAPLVFTRG